jgi:putative GTP pyrophosphokinase
MAALTKSRVDQAGRRVRDWWVDLEQPDIEPGTPLGDDAAILTDYRASFQEPLNKVTVGVRQFVARESKQVLVGQRLKRMPAILNKLSRFESMRMSQMEDIAGCRAILPGGAPEVAGVLRRIRRNWEVTFLRDYVAEPKDTGYRAIHVIVVRDGRFVEITAPNAVAAQLGRGRGTHGCSNRTRSQGWRRSARARDVLRTRRVGGGANGTRRTRR